MIGDGTVRSWHGLGVWRTEPGRNSHFESLLLEIVPTEKDHHKSLRSTYSWVFICKVIELVQSEDTGCPEICPWIYVLESKSLPKFMLELASLEILEHCLQLLRRDVTVFMCELNDGALALLRFL